MPSGSLRLSVLLALGLLSSTGARAEICQPPRLTSSAQACAFHSICDSEEATGQPAVADASASWLRPAAELEAMAHLAMEFGGFEASAWADARIEPSTLEGASGAAIGHLVDCLTVGGHSGEGRFHLPIRVTGTRGIGSMQDGPFPPPPDEPAQSRFTLVCAVGNHGWPSSPCDLHDVVWTDDGLIDFVIELEFPFFFGLPVWMDLSPRLSSRVSASGLANVLTGEANAQIEGTLMPAYVTDLEGDPLEGVTVAADSGFDYLAAPEAGGGGGAAIFALALLVRRVSTSR